MASPAAVARLEAGAKGGTAGVKEYDDAQAHVESARRDAVAGMNADAAKISAPTALTAQLGHQISAPAGVAQAGLESQGQAAAATNTADQQGSALYMREANAAIPVINAYANRDLGQQLAMLAAQRTAKVAKAPTDSAIKTELLGYAEAQRAERARSTGEQYQQDLQNLAQTDMTRRKNSAAVLANPSAGTTGSNQSSASRARSLGAPSADQELATPDAAMANLKAGQQASFDTTRQQKMDALAALQNRLAGPGIAQEAIDAGVAAGLDPNRLAGIFTPQVDASYVRANKDLGLYKDPNATVVRNVMAPNDQAAQAAGVSPELLPTILKSDFYDWQGNGKLNSKFAAWVKAPANAKIVQDATDANGVQDLNALHAKFEADPQAANLKTKFVDDIVASALSAIRHHYSYDDFVQAASQHAPYQGHGRTLAFVFEKVKPLFQSALVADTRTVAPGAYNDPTAYPGP